MLDFALHYARQGWPIFPLAENSKIPAIPRERGGRGCHDATLDLKRIEEWWREHPNANIGIATGRRSGLLVVDIDPRKTDRWLDSLRSLELPPTFTVRTAGGGWHLYLKFSGDERISIGTGLEPGLDWRGNGGYVVGPGSVVNGATYEIAKNLPIAPAPASLLERILAKRNRPRPTPDADGHMTIAAGQRNATLFALACLLRRFGLEFNAILECLRATNADHCDPPMEDEELRQIAGSAMRYAPSAEQRETK